MSNSLTVSFLGALQASLSVLLTIGVGVLASQFNILNQGTTKELSTLCVRIFLPCLLITNLGSNLTAESGVRYASILVIARFNSIVRQLLELIQGVDMVDSIHLPLHACRGSPEQTVETAVMAHPCHVLQQHHLASTPSYLSIAFNWNLEVLAHVRHGHNRRCPQPCQVLLPCLCHRVEFNDLFPRTSPARP